MQGLRGGCEAVIYRELDDHKSTPNFFLNYFSCCRDVNMYIYSSENELNSASDRAVNIRGRIFQLSMWVRWCGDTAVPRYHTWYRSRGLLPRRRVYPAPGTLSPSFGAGVEVISSHKTYFVYTLKCIPVQYISLSYVFKEKYQAANPRLRASREDYVAHTQTNMRTLNRHRTKRSSPPIPLVPHSWGLIPPTFMSLAN